MQDINELKERIMKLCRSGETVHVSVISKRPKINVVDAPARISEAYKNLFRVETTENGTKKAYTVQYTDLFIGKVKIREIEEDK